MPMHLIGEDGTLKGQVINFEKGDDWIIGRDPDHAQVVLHDSAVSRKHAHCFKVPEGVYITDLSTTNPILVNDNTILEPHLLKEGDHVKIGHTTFIYSEEEIPHIEKEEMSKSALEEMSEEEAEEELSPLPEELKEMEREKEEEEKESTFYMEKEPAFEEKSPEELSSLEVKSEEEEEEEIKEPTIFEESEKDESLYDLTPQTGLVLKVLSGPNAGAEFNLDENHTYILGKDLSSDIIFNDLSVSKEHAKLFVDADRQIFIEDMGSRNKTVVNSEEAIGKKEISPQDVISLGTTTFIIIDQSEEQPTLYTPLPELEKEEPIEEEEEARAIKEKIPEWKLIKIPTKHIVSVGAMLFVFLIIFINFFSLLKTEKVEVVKVDPIERIEKEIKRFDKVEFTYNKATGTIFLVGHILTPVDHEELIYNLKHLPFILGIEDNIVIDELIWKDCNQVLMENPEFKGVSLHAPEPGEFVLSGYVKTPQEGEKLSEYVNINFPFLDRLENRVVVENTLQAEIASLLIQQNFSSITFEIAGGDLVLAGRYDEKMEKEYKELLEKFEHLDGVYTVKDIAIASSSSSARIDLSNQYNVSGSAKRDGKIYSVVINGQIVSDGGIFAGMRITEISSHAVLLEKDGIKYKIDFNQ